LKEEEGSSDNESTTTTSGGDDDVEVRAVNESFLLDLPSKRPKQKQRCGG
jgi:hypothetical protein